MLAYAVSFWNYCDQSFLKGKEQLLAGTTFDNCGYIIGFYPKYNIIQNSEYVRVELSV